MYLERILTARPMTYSSRRLLCQYIMVEQNHGSGGKTTRGTCYFPEKGRGQTYHEGFGEGLSEGQEYAALI